MPVSCTLTEFAAGNIEAAYRKSQAICKILPSGTMTLVAGKAEGAGSSGREVLIGAAWMMATPKSCPFSFVLIPGVALRC